MNHGWLVAAIQIWIVAGCVTAPMTPEPRTAPIADLAACDAACDNLRALGCEAGNPTPNGVTCTQVCYETDSTGYARWGAACVRQARSCEDANRCQ